MKEVKPSIKYNVFVASSWHHICLSLAIINQENLKYNLILVFGSKVLTNSKTFFSELETLKKEQRFELVYVQGKASTWWPRFLKKRLIHQQTYNNMSQILDPVDGKKAFYIFNDSCHESQFLVNKYKTSWYENKFYLVQDGLSQYVKHSMPQYPWYKWIYNKWLYGSFWCPISQLGEYIKYDGIYSLLPEALMPRYNYKNSVKILSEDFYSKAWQRLSKAIIDQTFPEFFTLSKSDVIVFLPFLKTKSLAKKAKKEILALAQQDKCQNIYLKYHPRTLHKLKFAGTYDFNVEEIPLGIPAECFFAFNDQVSVKYYISLSTVVLLAALNVKEGQARAIMQKSLASLNSRIQANENFYKFLKEKLIY